MAEEVLVKDALTKDMIEAGKEAVRRFDEGGLKASTVLWLYIPEINAWRLLIASPDVKIDGPRKMYRKIQRILSKISVSERIPLKDISVVPKDDPLISSLRSAIKTKKDTEVSVASTSFNGFFIDDALIYRST